MHISLGKKNTILVDKYKKCLLGCADLTVGMLEESKALWQKYFPLCNVKAKKANGNFIEK